MKKLILLILIISLCAITSINAFAADITVSAGESPVVKENFDVYDQNFTNYGTVEVEFIFSVSGGTAINNGDITINYCLNIVEAVDKQSEFINNGTLTVGSPVNNCSFNIPSGTSFTNNGVVYLSNITTYDLSGTISGNGYFVCDSTVNADLVAALKSANRVVTPDEYQSLMGENSSSPDSKSHDVTATYAPGKTVQPTYKVDISWGSMEFTYTDSSKGTWNAETHRYEGAQETKWSWTEGANKITVTNHSNTAVTATATYTPKSEYENITMTFEDVTLNLGSADNGVGGANGTPISGTILVTPQGTLKESNNRVVIGSITITIS